MLVLWVEGLICTLSYVAFVVDLWSWLVWSEGGESEVDSYRSMPIPKPYTKAIAVAMPTTIHLAPFVFAFGFSIAEAFRLQDYDYCR